jgi:hypothetical protein
MALTTKLKLSNSKFFQCSGDNLSLSGSTSFGSIQYLTDQSGSYTARSLVDAAYLSGQTTSLQSQIDYVSGVTDTNTTDIATVSGLTETNATDISTNASDIATVSGLTETNATDIATNASDIATVSGLTETNATDIATNASDIATVSGLTETNATDIATVSGLTETNASDIATVSGLTETNATDISTNASDIATVSGLTETNATDIATVSGLTETNATDIATNASDIATVSGLTETNATDISTNASDIATVSGLTETNATDISTNASDIATVSGLTETNATDIATVSGLTETNATDIATNASDIATVSGLTETNATDIATNAANIAVTITGATNGLTKSGQDVKLGGTDMDEFTNISGTGYLCIDNSGGIGLGPAGGLALGGCAGGTVIHATGSGSLCFKSDGISVCGNDIKYCADYSASYVARSIPDVAWVTGQTGAIGAANGLTRVGDNIELGGSLTGATIVSLTGNDIDFIDSKRSISVGANDITIKYSANTNCNSTMQVDSTDITLLATDSTSGDIVGIIGESDVPKLSMFGGGLAAAVTLDSRTLTYASGASSYDFSDIPHAGWVTGQTGAIDGNNGLTRSGDNIILGGALTGNTEVSGTDTLLISAPFEVCDVQYQKFDSTPTISGHEEGRLYYKNCSLNFEREISGVTLQIGEEQVIRVSNQTGNQIDDGSVVYINGATGGVPTITKSQANNSASNETIGLLTYDLADNNEGYVTTQGLVRGVNTGAYIVSDILYLSTSVAGGWTKTVPTHPDNVVKIGTVTKVGTLDGEILVDVRWLPDHVDVNVFTGYTATTQTEIDNKLDTSIFNTYSGTTDGRLDAVEIVTDVSITGVTNGLTKVGDDCAKLGGALTEATSLSGAYTLNIQPSCALTLRTTEDSSIGIDAQCNSTLSLKSQSGQVDNANSFTNAIGILADFDQASGFIVYDNRAGSNQEGIRYASDYSLNYDDRSLVDKAYVDTVATGLQAKAAVVVATTENIDLTGGTFTSGSTIDGEVILDTYRVLVKDQTGATENGIWVFSGASDTFYRAADYDGAPSGEVSNGDLVPVITGATHASTQWILTTQDPITIGVSELLFSLFSQLLQISGGDGIDITNVSGVQEISVDLASNSALEFAANKLTVADEIAGSGLTWTNGVVGVNACNVAPVGDEIAVRFGTGNDLFVDKADFSYTTASNGLTKADCNITLGGTLTGNTTIDGDSGTYDLTLNGLDSFNVGFDNVSTITDGGTNGGLRYAGDYSANYTCRSLVDAEYVNDTVTGSTLTFDNGLTKVGDTISWGGALTGDTFVNWGAGRLCMTDGGTSAVMICSDCSVVQVQNTSLCIRSCQSASCNGEITIANTGAISISTNNASTGITITDSGAGVGAVYIGDYSSTFVDRSLVDKGWVDAQIGTITTDAITGATNGLTKSGQDVKLGGTLTENTTINGACNNLCLGSTGNRIGTYSVNTYSTFFGTESNITLGSNYELSMVHSGGTCSSMLIAPAGDEMCLFTKTTNGNIQEICFGSSFMRIYDSCNCAPKFAGDYSATYSARSIPDAAWVTSQVDAIDGVNGLTRIGDNIILGGALTGDTTIGSGSSDLSINTTNLFISGTTHIGTIATGSVSDSVLVVDIAGEIKSIDASLLGEDNNRYEITGVSNSVVNLYGNEYVVLIDANAGAVTVNLPTGATIGTAVKLKDKGDALTNIITIDAGSGKFIDGSQCATINTNYGALELVYGETNNWYSLAFIN